ncbi:MAG: hypothetical protein H7099_16815 [Gemmatimonadaceae bacterium]|nr:hypothetical protein [Gemmatimonadaceae bacterium]
MTSRATHRSIDAGPRSIAARRSIGVALAVAFLLSVNGCYAFIPTTNPALPERTPVSVHLTLAGTVAMQSTLGAGVNEVDGTVLRSRADSLVLAVENMYTTGRQKFESSGTTAAIPRPYIEDVKVRTFSRKRTTLTIIGALVLAIVGAAGVSAASGSGNPGGGVIQP